MAESRQTPGERSNSSAKAPPRMPRWVKISALAGGAVLAAAGIVAVASGGEHGPGRHLGAANEAGVPADPVAEPAAGEPPPIEPAAP